MKRLIDILLSLLLVPVALPLCVFLMFLIRLETPGSPLFRQVRVGRNRKAFFLLKLRTMFSGTDQVASHLVAENRITRLGGVLRRLKLDELPQLLNVLDGSMSLVGPRPCLPSQYELVAERDRLGLFKLRPGVTGPAQIAGIDMADPVRLAAVEAAYFRSASVRRDIAIIWRTATGSGRGDASVTERQQSS